MMEVLRNPRFRAIWYVVNVVEVTRWMELLVTSVLVYSLTDSSLMLGLVLAFENIPRPFFSPFTGIIADRFDRKKIWVSALAIKWGAGIVIFFLLAFGYIAAWHVFASMFLQGVSRALEDPARRTAVYDIVGERRVVNALSIDSISMTMGRMFGPFAGGFLVEHVGYFWPHYAGYVWAYAAVVVLHTMAMLLAIRVSIPKVEREWRAEPIWNSLGDVAREAFNHRQLIGMLFITIMINAMAFPARQFVPAIGRDYLKVGETLVGILAASEAIGQLVMAGVLASIGTIRYHGRYFAAGAFTVMVTSTVFAWLPWYPATFAVLVISGIGLSCFGTMQSAITMRSSPPEMRGRMVGLDEPVHRHWHAAGRFDYGPAGRHHGHPVVDYAERAGVHCGLAAHAVPDAADYAPVAAGAQRAYRNPHAPPGFLKSQGSETWITRRQPKAGTSRAFRAGRSSYP